ncbi:MAG: KpsF/GutQ family sugar-phosphate isomerase [Gemmatimonadaceae bacterium]
MKADILARGRRVLEQERDALGAAGLRLGEEFVTAVEMIANSNGRVIVCGVGKSGLIGRKVAATLTSTGTPAVFLHASDSLHGDLGIVGTADIAILISKSGESEELLPLLQHLKRIGVGTIAIAGERNSTLGTHSDVTLDASVAAEACPHGLAPTTSTTVALALGDALAVALLEEKRFGAEDFARIHPGGALGRKLLTRVRDVMVTDSLPVLPPTATVREAIVELAERRGIVMIVDPASRVIGLMTAGDLARLMERDADVMTISVTDVMTSSPRTIGPDELGSAAVHAMEQHGIMAMPVLARDGSLVGVVHLHDLMRAGVA